jgi:hypothetical protein
MDMPDRPRKGPVSAQDEKMNARNLLKTKGLQGFFARGIHSPLHGYMAALYSYHGRRRYGNPP